jgi:hypothetical protein
MPARTRTRSGLLLLVVLLLAGATASADSTSASFRLRGLHPASVGPAIVSGPTFRSGASLGQAEALGPSGSDIDLSSSYPGFWSVVAHTVPSLDGDGDGIQRFRDDDDDDDGLPDGVETGTGIFVSPEDTGTDPLNPDSDADGRSDHQEVAEGTDPNDPASPTPRVPTLGAAGRLLLAAALLLGWWSALRGRNHEGA